MSNDPRPETQKELHQRLIQTLQHAQELFAQLINKDPDYVQRCIIHYVRTYGDAIETEIEDYENRGYV